MKTVTWMFLIIPLIFASQETLYLKKLEGESALFVCASEETGSHPIGLYLKRECTGPEREVMFFSESGPEGKPEDKERIQVLGDLSTIPVNVTISQLERRDSGLYFCEFVYAGESEDRVIRGKEEFFLFVDTVKIHEGLQCGCQNYPPLLYAISAAVGLLLLILLGLAASHCGKQCKRSKPQKPAPIYEEMNARQPANGKAPRRHLDPAYPEEADASVYINPQIKHRQENHYVNPREKQPDSGAGATATEDSQ
ncbi:cd7 antigen-like [Anguilla anguilla]|uniref:Ig-like domain-containing protein n=1 Tax=Anguilla anguilla TaxID=7936 RepID=A0A9D3S390_ANGAN|nr:cd7 antigen-like [Anguilla anguilla]KAG5853799.1 hypothetical protein ANANG_G00030260 [Anguilla anguilla]